MKKLLAFGVLSLAALGLEASSASAWLFGHCGCCSQCCSVICCRQYNAFTPCCFGNICCVGCCPLAPAVPPAPSVCPTPCPPCPMECCGPAPFDVPPPGGPSCGCGGPDLGGLGGLPPPGGFAGGYGPAPFVGSQLPQGPVPGPGPMGNGFSAPMPTPVDAGPPGPAGGMPLPMGPTARRYPAAGAGVIQTAGYRPAYGPAAYNPYVGYWPARPMPPVYGYGPANAYPR